MADEPQAAHGIYYATDETGALTFSLIDGAGRIFAIACIPSFGVDELRDFLNGKDDDDIGEVAGHA
jgi:hypothetical protein